MIKISKGDIVEIVAPAGFSEAAELIHAVDQIKKWGLTPRCLVDFEAFHPFHSDDDDIRLKDLKRALTAQDSKIIWCLRGGYGSARLLNDLKKMHKPKNEKIFIGYSDLTSLHSFLNQNWNWKTIHGPMITSFGNKNFDKKSLKEIKEILFCEKKKINYELGALNFAAEKKGLKVEGLLVGGNLTVMQSLIGTPFEIVTKNKILIIEEINERGYRIDRMLNHLSMSKMLKGCQAIIFGQFLKGEGPQGENFVDFALMRFALDQNVPVFTSNEFGHGDVNRPLIFNQKCSIKKLNLEIKI